MKIFELFRGKIKSALNQIEFSVKWLTILSKIFFFYLLSLIFRLKDFAKYSEPCSSEILVESPENVEMGGKINSIRLCMRSRWKKYLRYTLYVATCFLMYLLNTWFPKLFIKMAFIDSNEDNAELVIVYGAGKIY